ncbi:MAG TPA: CotH kinase family protein, partial [Polyangiaceae bacterium]|nr:CotH kinase family protein [Polyangiaceae bacterium]
MILTVRESFRRLHYRLIRLKLLREHSFGQLTLGYRLLHIRPLSGLVLSAPAAMFVAWYSGMAISTHRSQNSVTQSEEPLTAEVFQLHLHDHLTQDVRRLQMEEPNVRSELPTYNLVVRNDRLSQLDAMLPPDEGKANYVEGFLEHKNRIYEVEARYRGAKHWHWANAQKSWKIRVKGNHLMFGGLPTFNFVNTPDPMPFNEQMVLDVARSEGLLTPSYYPFRLQLNSAFLGVYFFEAQADEGLLRQSHRMPGSIYSGAGAPINQTTQVSSLWESAENWKKVGASGDKEEHDVRELAGLLHAVNQSNAVEFAAFAETALNVEKFATFDAVDVVFGNNQHDYHQNHKLYFDPYKNRFEPIATDFRDMGHERQLNRTENPLLLRLKQLPDYLTRRNRKVYELVTGSCSSASVADRTSHWIELLAVDQARDPYWDAYELLPVMGTYYRQLVRPMNEERQSTASQMRLREHGIRADYLRKELERLEVSAALVVPSPDPAQRKPKPRWGKPVVEQFESKLSVTVDGSGAFEWLEAKPEFAAGCTPTEWQLYADRDLD